MIPNSNSREVTTNGSVASAAFGISLKDSAHIMTILRDTLYSDKILAVLREYGSNAWDAHRDAGKHDVPIVVTLPTRSSPTLTIRDYGKGLSREDIFNVYTQYGSSTKRDSNTAVGMLGIGSKSGFAYADSFTVVSYHNGTRSTYVAALDSSEKGTVDLLDEGPCGEETGIMIQLAVALADITEFHTKACALYKYFDPRPSVNIQLPELPKDQTALKSGIIYHGQSNDLSGWVAIMGCVPYRINLSQVSNHGTGLPSFVHKLTGALRFSIGEVDINASREELKYSNATKDAIIKKLDDLTTEYVQTKLKEFGAKNLSPWDLRRQVQVLAEFKKFLPKHIVAKAEYRVNLYTFKQKTFKIYSDKHTETTSIIPSADCRLIIKDDNRSLKGFAINQYTDHVVRREWKNLTDDELKEKKDAGKDKPSWAEFEKEFEDFLIAVDIKGITVLRTSQMPWITHRRPPANVNIKHKKRVFVFAPKTYKTFRTPFSDFWDADDRVPTDDDVYVNIEGFRPANSEYRKTLVEAFADDARICGILKEKIPAIYGYKINQAQAEGTQQIDARKGMQYDAWRKSLFDRLIKCADFLKIWEFMQWFNEYGNDYSYYGSQANKKIIDTAKRELGSNHQITVFVCNKMKFCEEYTKLYQRDYYNILNKMIELYPKELDRQKSQAVITNVSLSERYKLFSIPEISLSELTGEHASKWIHYIQMIDKGNP